MAQAFVWGQDMAVAIAGMKADATVDVVDSFAAETELNPGDAVIRGTDAGAQIKAAGTSGDGAKVIGIAVHTHKGYDGVGAYYEQGYCVPVMTFGDVYVKVGGTVTAGSAVAITIADGGHTFTAAGDGAETITGMTYLADGAEGDIVPVRIRK